MEKNLTKSKRKSKERVAAFKDRWALYQIKRSGPFDLSKTKHAQHPLQSVEKLLLLHEISFSPGCQFKTNPKSNGRKTIATKRMISSTTISTSKQNQKIVSIRYIWFWVLEEDTNSKSWSIILFPQKKCFFYFRKI